MSKRQVGLVAGVEAGRRVQFEALTFRACCADEHVRRQLSTGPCGPECHADRYHEDCPACILKKDYGVVADSHPAPQGIVRRLNDRLRRA